MLQATKFALPLAIFQCADPAANVTQLQCGVFKLGLSKLITMVWTGSCFCPAAALKVDSIGLCNILLADTAFILLMMRSLMVFGPAQVWPEGIHGMQLKVEGFSHKLPVLTKAVFEQIASFKVRTNSSLTSTQLSTLAPFPLTADL